MDVQRQQHAKPLWLKHWYVPAIIGVLILGFLLKQQMGNASYFVDRGELVTAKVVQGNFKVNVRAMGVLKPLNIRWVSSQVSGRVEQVMVKPGAKVNEGDILIYLSNPELHRELEQAQWELSASKAESHAAFVSLESQLVELENSVIAAELNYQSAKLKLDAETALMEQGNATVSALDYQKSQLAVKQQMQSWLAQQQKVKKMHASMKATQEAQQARIGLMENNYRRVKAQVEALQVIATSSGVVQQVSLQLGERAQVGDSVALIADQHALFAELQVEEVRARDILLGQSAVVDTRTNEILGEVIRIDPAVNAGMVQVDIKLISELPSEARPELTVDGLIEISNISDALYVKRPVFAPKNSAVPLFLLSADKQFAHKSIVQLGQSSVNKIQIVSGLNVGDEIIISDTNDWQEHDDIMIR
ncbi:HlyD family secretion protein [Thalassotalea fusca]